MVAHWTAAVRFWERQLLTKTLRAWRTHKVLPNLLNMLLSPKRALGRRNIKLTETLLSNKDPSQLPSSSLCSVALMCYLVSVLCAGPVSEAVCECRVHQCPGCPCRLPPCGGAAPRHVPVGRVRHTNTASEGHRIYRSIKGMCGGGADLSVCVGVQGA